MRLVVLVACALLASVLGVRTAVADSKRPWADGVSPAAQKAALELYERGNQLFVQKSYAEALALYREAIVSWDHPAIRFNMAECLISLDQPLEAYENVVSSLRFGEPALGYEHFERAMRTKQLLEGQIATAEVSCDEAGAIVTLDGKRLFVAPGRATRSLLPGPHQIVASKPGYVTVTREEIVLPRKTVRVAIELERVRTFQYRWKRWKPWAVVGGGVAVGLVGLVFRYQAQSAYDEFHEDLTEVCPQGCPRSVLPDDLVELEDAGSRWNGAAVASYSIGGAVAVAGLVLVLYNQERAVESPLPTGAALSTDGRRWSVSWRF